MKTITALFLVLILFSCGKESFKGNNGITGKWKLKEQTSGLGINGGTWIPVSSGYVKQLQFFANGAFQEYETTRQVPRTCDGTYQLNADSLLVIHSACETSADTIAILIISKMQLQLMYRNQYYRSERYEAIK